MRKSVSFLLILLWLLPDAVRAQAPPPGQPDPLVQLMMSQPPVDTTSPVQAFASFDPPAVRPGERCTYRVTFNALIASIQWPEDIIAPSQLELSPGGRGELIQLVGTNQQPRTTFNYRARTASLGSFAVPRFLVYVYGKPVTVPAAKLDVVPTPPAFALRTPQLLLDVPATNLFLGQPVNVRVLLPGSDEGVVEGVMQVQFNGRGFMVDASRVQQRIEAIPRGGRNVATFIFETVITPIEAGRITLTAQGFTSGNNFGGMIVVTGPATIPGGPPQYFLVDSDPVILNVRPLPHDKELPGFSGAIGTFTNDPPKLATNIVRVGDPVTLTITIRGQGNLGRLIAPPPPHLPGWQVFDAASDNTPPQAVQARGFATFIYTLIPTTETTRATPAIPFSFFEPQSGAYVDLTIPPVPITVKPGTQPADVQAWAQAEVPTVAGEKEPVLSGLASSRGRTAHSLAPPQRRGWLFQLAPALVFAGLWMWDRRRRYLEQHPDVVLRRCARRALHREWRALRKAAQSGDAPRFAGCAVNAMRVACAPHYPAEPRALVGGDVLPLLDPAQREARLGKVVRRIFSVTDAGSFGANPVDVGELLLLRSELERVLEQLEAKL